MATARIINPRVRVENVRLIRNQDQSMNKPPGKNAIWKLSFKLNVNVDNIQYKIFEMHKDETEIEILEHEEEFIIYHNEDWSIKSYRGKLVLSQRNR